MQQKTLADVNSYVEEMVNGQKVIKVGSTRLTGWLFRAVGECGCSGDRIRAVGECGCLGGWIRAVGEGGCLGGWIRVRLSGAPGVG